MAKNRHKKFILIKNILKKFFILLPFLVVSLTCVYFYFSYDLPSINDIIGENTEQKINIYYSNGVDKIKSYNVNSLYSLSYEQLPQHFIDALISTEDKNFFKHSGFNIISIIRAFVVNFKSKSIKQGGSTITQQLAKMILNDNSNNYKRKIKELLFALKLEKNLSKQDILLLYLNTAYFGAGQYGIIEASNFYFNKNVENIDLYESALLVALLKAPSKYNPLKHFDLSMKRTEIVLQNMRNNKMIDESQFKTTEELKKYFSTKINKSNIKQESYFFSDYVLKQYNLLNIGNSYNEISIISTLDKNIQEQLLYTTRQFINDHRQQLDNSKIAVIVMKKTGEIVAMYGGKNYSNSPFNFATDGNRQIGSLFKIFIYLTALENGLNIDDTYIDSPIQIGNWTPKNNDSKYRGKILVKDAFAFSSNSVAIQIAKEYGIDNVVATAEKMGFKVNNKKHLSFLLGTDTESLLNITGIYNIIFSDGKNITPYCIKNITADDDNIILTKNNNRTTLFNRDSIKQLQYLLYNVIDNGTGQNAKIINLINKTDKNIINQNYLTGGKTGTSQNGKDAWFIGLVDEYVIGVWIGKDNNGRSKITGGTLPSMLWKAVAESIIKLTRIN